MIRIFQHGDHPAVAEIFTSAVHEIASRVYTPEQCLAWSAREVNYEHWKRRCELKRPFLGIVDGEVAGFLELDPDGHIACAYVNPRFQRRGVVTELVQHAATTCFDLGLPRVYVEASICAKPMFEKLGFETTSEFSVRIRDIELLNYRMEKQKP